MKRLLCALLTLVMCLGAVTVVSAADSLRFYIEVDKATSETVSARIMYDNKVGFDVGSFGLVMDYSEGMSLTAITQSPSIGGMMVNSADIKTKPQMIVWAGGTVSLNDGKGVVAELVFSVSDENDLRIDLEVDKDSGVCNPDGIMLDENRCVAEGCDIEAMPDLDFGDANGDGKINLVDASTIMKYAAKWVIDINETSADALRDYKVNLSDASQIMKYNAKWSTVRLGHNDVQNVIVKATCKTTGTTELMCKNCGLTEQVTTPLVGCEYELKGTVDPTCAKEGAKNYVCSVCGKTKTESIPKTNTHKYVKKITTAATCGKSGVATYTCSVCGKSFTETIAATGAHTYVRKTTTAATCTKTGVYTYTCQGCGKSYTESIPKTGHTYKNGVCTGCGAKQSGINQLCTWLKQNGKVSDDGDYYQDEIYYINDSAYYISINYSVSDNELMIAATNADDSVGITAMIDIDLNNIKGEYNFSVIATDTYSDVIIGFGITDMTPSEYNSASYINFEFFVSDIYDYCPYDFSDLAKTFTDLSLMLADELCEDNGLIFRVADLGLRY